MCCVEIIQQDISSLSLPLSYFYDIKSTFNVDGFETVHHIFTFYWIPGGTGGQTFEKADCNTYIFHFVWCGYIETWEIHQFGNIIREVLWISVVSYSAITWCCKREKNNILYNLCRLQKLYFSTYSVQQRKQIVKLFSSFSNLPFPSYSDKPEFSISASLSQPGG